MRELELIVSTFDLPSTSPRFSRKDQRRSELDDKPTSPNVILDTIKHTLRIYKQNLEETSSQVRIE